ncbi:putative ABC transporter ATP-binding protein YejF [compost metagenome]
MEKGVLVETGETAQVFAAPQHPYTRKLIDSRPKREVLPLVPLAPVLLEARSLCVSYARKRRGIAGWFGKDQFAAVKDVDFQLREGETIGIVGESGSGKTTLAHTVLALQRKGAGTIHFLGRSFDDATRKDRCQLRSRMQVVFQDPFGSLSPRMTIEQIVGEGLALHQQQVLALLSQLQHKYNLSYLFISHDLAVIRAMAHRVIVMKAGEVVETGETEAVLGAPQHPYTRKLMAAAQVGAA